MHRDPSAHRRPSARLLTERILVIDGAMGTMVQQRKLTEADYRGERFKTWRCDLKGNSDMLVLTRPKSSAAFTRAYLEAGADIIETNTFTANYSSQADYGMEELVAEINLAAARVAREAADDSRANTGQVHSWPAHSARRIARRRCRRTSTIRLSQHRFR